MDGEINGTSKGGVFILLAVAFVPLTSEGEKRINQ